MATERELSDFLASVEKRAFKRSVYHVRDEEAALDIVQDSMMKLAEHYGDKPANELPMLFQRILSNCTLDWFRRQKTRNALFSNLSDFESASDEGDFDLLETYSSPEQSQQVESAEDATRRAQVLRQIEGEIMELPARQRLSDALLGGHGRGRNRRGHGLLGRQCQDPLLPGRRSPQQGTEGKGNSTMTTTDPLRASAADQFGRAVAMRLAAGADELPYEVRERLRAARARALAARKLPEATPVIVGRGGAATLAGERSWFNRLASVLPLLVLAAGLVLIYNFQSDRRATELAEVDAALLTDELPPAAYADPGFLQFLKTGGGD